MNKKLFYRFCAASATTAFIVSQVYYKETLGHIYTGVYRSSNLIKALVQSFGVYYREGEISDKHIQAAIHLREALEKNSGIYIKFGQVIASIELLVPPEYITELSKLFERAPITSFPEVVKILEDSMGGEVSQFFMNIDPNPIAAGSIAQVHSARLLNGEQVAVKVQHPKLASTLRYDMALCEAVVKVLKLCTKDYNFDWMIEDMKKYLPIELNFNIETSNCVRIQELFKNDTKIRTPKVYLELCSEKVIVMEYINGYSIVNVDRLTNDKISLKEVAKNISWAFNKMIFELGFIHGDPHPGNIFVEPLKGDYKIVLLDHGLYRIMSPATRVSYAKLWTGLITQNEELIKEACEEFNLPQFYKTFASIVTHQDYNEIINSKEKSAVKRLNELRNDKQKLEKSLQKARMKKREIFKCLELMNKELLLVLKVNSYLDTIEGKLGPKYYNIYFTAKFAFDVYLRHLNQNAQTLRKKLAAFWMIIYCRFMLSALIFYDWRNA